MIKDLEPYHLVLSAKIRRLGLNDKPVKSKPTQRHCHHQHKSNSVNLIRVRKNGFKLDTRIIFATCNI